MTEYNRIVIKIGTSTLAHDTGLLNIRRVESLVKVLSDIKNSGREIIIVSSGAIGMGMGKLGLKRGFADMPTRQACAAVGQGALMHTYDMLFCDHHHNIAQVLLTRDVIDDAQRKINITNTLGRLLELGCIPIVNENDTVATEEIEFGENDILSAMVAVLIKADLLIMLTDTDGLYDSSPEDNMNARLISRVNEIDDRIRQMAGGTGSRLGSGGMTTKIEAAAYAGEFGVPTVVTNGAHPKRLYDILEGKNIGTMFQLTIDN